ncbi:MAG: DUF6252 family protein [Sphingobacteriales bacterium]
MNLTRKIRLTCCGLLLMSACKKDKPTPNNYISFYANDVYNIAKPGIANIDDETFLLDAGPDMKGEIGLFIDTNVQLKTYHLENEADNAICDYYDSAGTHFWSATGVLVVNAFDGKHISGSFSFTGHPLDDKSATVHITEGHFSTDVTNDSFSADSCTVCDSAFSFSRRAPLANRYLWHKQIAVKLMLR